MPANEQERAQAKELFVAVQEATQQSVEVTFVDQGYTGDNPKNDAKEAGIELLIVILSDAKKGFVLLHRRLRWNVVLLGLPAFVVWRVILKHS